VNPVFAVWNGLLTLIQSGLEVLHNAFDPVFGVHAWGWAIIGLTVVIRVLLLPLAIKQTRSMRAMQTLQPRIKAIQKKHKADRDLMRKDPAKYQERKKKMNEEVMALYKEEGVNPAAGCLPLLLQAPIFFALFRVLNNPDLVLAGDQVAQAPFYVFRPLGEAANADVFGWLLIVAMGATMFVTQRQMSGRTPAEGAQAQQQKIMMFGMPVFLAVIAQSLPIGVLLYWVTTNLWQLGQQAAIIREVKANPAEAGPSGNGQVKAEGGATPAAARAKGKRTSSPRKRDTSPPARRPSRPADHLPGGGGARGRKRT
jgi:YidC/Oxa1 family membrane protein insertase